ncbi:2'-5' RNA ligase family protein [Microlunatus parietis]|uniref:2'-5' RNA ligase n=1 Tax=Microlunatus parietis TaxID=682979 RepID=A0A7Y9I6Z5_9ACTN|nr:2'-5' RNA ligase family protein [Microlunatus parietis]NYE71273.1 2'-5' RNA ligase [Microlunatus parietis]
MTHAEQLRNHWYWRPGWRVGTRGYYWHLTWDGHSELHRLVDEYQAVLAPFAGLDPIPRPWLHLTLQGIGFTDEVSDDQLEELTDRARSAIAGLGPIRVRFDRVLVWGEAVVLAPTPAEPIEVLRAELRELTGAVTGATPGRDDFSPHVSFAYVNTDQPAAEVVAAVESIQPEPAEVIIDTVTLLEQHRDNGMYEWKVRDTLPLT